MLKTLKIKPIAKVSIVRNSIINEFVKSNSKVSKAKKSLSNSKIWLKLVKFKN